MILKAKILYVGMKIYFLIEKIILMKNSHQVTPYFLTKKDHRLYLRKLHLTILCVMRTI
jgi:hypothetical protein